MIPAGFYYDGQSSRSVTVDLLIESGSLRIIGDTVNLSFPVDSLRLQEPVGGTPLKAYLPNGGVLEIPELNSWTKLFPDRKNRFASVETGLKGLLLSVLIIAVGVSSFFIFLLPAIVPAIGRAIPGEFVTRLDRGVLRSLDTSVFSPSSLSAEKQREVLKDWRIFCNLVEIDCSKDVYFRKSDKLGANAATLPGGGIVVTDELVRIANDNQQVIAILAHERGHDEHNHVLNSLVHAGSVTFLVAMVTGDVTGVIPMAAIGLSQLSFSREQEFEADRFAQKLLMKAYGTAEPLATMFERMTPRALQSIEKYGQYVSTHPATEERVKIIRQSVTSK